MGEEASICIAFSFALSNFQRMHWDFTLRGAGTEGNDQRNCFSRIGRSGQGGAGQGRAGQGGAGQGGSFSSGLWIWTGCALGSLVEMCFPTVC